MPMFRLASTAAQEALVVEFYDTTCAAALGMAQRACLSEADLWQESDYLFTLRKPANEGDFWIIYQKPELSQQVEAAA